MARVDLPAPQPDNSFMSNSISERVQRIAADVLQIPLRDVTPQTSPENVDQWDSVQHLNLVMALEQELNLEFQPEEIESMTDIGAIIKVVAAKSS